MGRPHSKAEKSSTATYDEKVPVSPRPKLKKDHERRNKKKFGFSKKKSKLESLKTPRSAMISPPPDGFLPETELEIEIKRRMQDQLAFNSDIFVLNQMMMSVQFFANYERYKVDLISRVSSSSGKCSIKPFSSMQSLISFVSSFNFESLSRQLNMFPNCSPSTVSYRPRNTKQMPRFK